MSSILISLFLKYFDASLKSSFVILIIILLRFVFKRFPKRSIAVLWTVVWIRLLIPIPIRANFSFIPKKAAETIIAETVNSQNDLHLILAVIWSALLVVLLLCAVISALRLRRRFKRISDNVYAPVDRARKVIPMFTCTGISSAFVYGVFRPYIVLSEELKQEDRRCIILHEATHIRRFDPLKKILAYLSCAIHWFNPLVWLAFRLFNNDIEMACDETVLRFAEISPIVYSQALLNSTAQRKGILHVSFGAGSVGARIRNILCRDIVSPTKLALLTIICTLTTCMLLFDPPKPMRVIPIEDIKTVYQPIAEPAEIIPESEPEVLEIVPSDTDVVDDVSSIEANIVNMPKNEMYSVITVDLRALKTEGNYEY